ncbi:MAG: hypothetical protein LBL42_03580, partial [Tannerella sp.]|nr:hypothetical protein [Tannerella sp.]
ADLLKQGASTLHLEKSGRTAADYLLAGYLKYQRHRQAQLADEKTFIQYWSRVRPQTLTYECENRLFHVDSHSMLFFLLLLMRNTADSQPRQYSRNDDDIVLQTNIGAFCMEELERFAALMPDEILPPYRKKRTYINGVMALHEEKKDSPYCKKAFVRAERGWYVLNPVIIWGYAPVSEEPS